MANNRMSRPPKRYEFRPDGGEKSPEKPAKVPVKQETLRLTPKNRIVPTEANAGEKQVEINAERPVSGPVAPTAIEPKGANATASVTSNPMSDDRGESVDVAIA